jgi:hypothetical protein
LVDILIYFHLSGHTLKYPNNSIAADNIGAGDAANVLAPKIMDLQNYMKLVRGFTDDDSGAG